MPFPSGGAFAAGRVRIGHDEGVVGVWVGGEVDVGFFAHLRWGELVAQFGFDAGRGPLHVEQLLGCGGNHIGDDFRCCEGLQKRL